MCLFASTSSSVFVLFIRKPTSPITYTNFSLIKKKLTLSINYKVNLADYAFFRKAFTPLSTLVRGFLTFLSK